MMQSLGQLTQQITSVNPVWPTQIETERDGGEKREGKGRSEEREIGRTSEMKIKTHREHYAI